MPPDMLTCTCGVRHTHTCSHMYRPRHVVGTSWRAGQPGRGLRCVWICPRGLGRFSVHYTLRLCVMVCICTYTEDTHVHGSSPKPLGVFFLILFDWDCNQSCPLSTRLDPVTQDLSRSERVNVGMGLRSIMATFSISAADPVTQDLPAPPPRRCAWGL